MVPPSLNTQYCYSSDLSLSRSTISAPRKAVANLEHERHMGFGELALPLRAKLILTTTANFELDAVSSERLAPRATGANLGFRCQSMIDGGSVTWRLRTTWRTTLPFLRSNSATAIVPKSFALATSKAASVVVLVGIGGLPPLKAISRAPVSDLPTTEGFPNFATNAASRASTLWVVPLGRSCQVVSECTASTVPLTGFSTVRTASVITPGVTRSMAGPTTVSSGPRLQGGVYSSAPLYLAPGRMLAPAAIADARNSSLDFSHLTPRESPLSVVVSAN